MWTDLAKCRVEGFPNHFFSDLWAVGFGGPTMLTAMTEEDWTIVLRVFAASRVAARRQGPERPKVSRSPALFCGS